MININFYKNSVISTDELGNNINDVVIVGSLEGSISKIKQGQLSAGYDINSTLFSITVPYDQNIWDLSEKAEVESVKYQILERERLRINNKMVFMCKKVK